MCVVWVSYVWFGDGEKGRVTFYFVNASIIIEIESFTLISREYGGVMNAFTWGYWEVSSLLSFNRGKWQGTCENTQILIIIQSDTMCWLMHSSFLLYYSLLKLEWFGGAYEYKYFLHLST